MQVHPGSEPREYNADVMTESILETHDVGLGDEFQWPEGDMPLSSMSPLSALRKT